MSIPELNNVLNDVTDLVVNKRSQNPQLISKLVERFSLFLDQVLSAEFTDIPPTVDMYQFAEMNDKAIICVNIFFSMSMKERVLTVQTKEEADQHRNLNTLLTSYFDKLVKIIPDPNFWDEARGELEQLRPVLIICQDEVDEKFRSTGKHLRFGMR